MWSRFGELARERGADVASVLAFSETLWLWADAVMDIVGSAHREVELEQAREEQQRRDAFVFALLYRHARRGRAAAAERDVRARRRPATTSPFRARATGDAVLPRRVAMALAGDDGLVTGARPRLRRDRRAPAASKPGVACGLGPPVAAGGAAGRVRVREPRAADRGRVRAGGGVLARRPLDPSRDPGRRGARRRVRRALPRAARGPRPARRRARDDVARVVRPGDAGRGHRPVAAHPSQHAAPPAAPLRGRDRGDAARPAHPRRALVGARAPAPGRLTARRTDSGRAPSWAAGCQAAGMSDRVAIITDIHANLPALEAALARIEELGIERVYCGGDLVGYGPHPNEVCALIAARGIPTIYGNYDHAIARDLEDCGCAYVTAHDRELGQRSVEWTLAHTEPAAKAFMRELPFDLRFTVGEIVRASGARFAAQGQRVPVRGQAGAAVRAPRRRRGGRRARLRSHPQAVGALLRRRAVRQLRLGRQAQGRRSARRLRDPRRRRRRARA